MFVSTFFSVCELSHQDLKSFGGILLLEEKIVCALMEMKNFYAWKNFGSDEFF